LDDDLFFRVLVANCIVDLNCKRLADFGEIGLESIFGNVFTEIEFQKAHYKSIDQVSIIIEFFVKVHKISEIGLNELLVILDNFRKCFYTARFDGRLFIFLVAILEPVYFDT